MNRTLLQVMLVDDDLLLLEEIKSIICWNALGFELAGVFKNGSDALKKIDDLAPDIVITDIRMPVMNGLEFVAELRHLYPQIKVLLLTAYSEFDYAQKAVELGVSGYVLKHELTPELLTERLNAIRCNVEAQQEHRRLSERRMLENILLPPPGNAGAIAAFRSEFCQEHGGSDLYLMLLRRQGFPYVKQQTDGPVTSQSQAICKRVREAMTESDRSEARTLCIPWYNGQALVLAFFPRVVSGFKQNSLLYPLAQRLSECVCPRDVAVNCVLISNCCHAPEFLRGELARLNALEERTFLFGRDRVLFCNQLQPCESSPEQLKKMRTELSRALSVGTVDEGFLALKAFFAEQSIEAVHEGYEGMTALIAQKLRQETLEDFLQEEFRQQAQECYTPQELWQSFEAFFHQMREMPLQNYSPRIAAVINYIQEHYGSDLTVQQVAEELGLNSEYLNKLFKKEVGVGFSKYLTDCRMTVARRLLKSGKWRVSEVAQQVGYKSSQYFSITFRKTIGQTPSQVCAIPEELL